MIRKATVAIMALTLVLTVGAGQSFAKKGKYNEGAAGKGSIAGVVNLKGDPPPPIIENLAKGKNSEFCSTHPDADPKAQTRPRVKVEANGGKLVNAVVFIEEIKEGKPWDWKGVNFDFKTCDIFPKITVARKTDKKTMDKDFVNMSITNQDPEILHNPHGYAVKGANRKTLFNKPLPNKGDVANVSKNIKRLKDDHFFLQCDQHNFMEADARVVWNPYYAITGDDGSFKIDGIPAGKYKVTAWHPYVGEVTKEVTVGDAEAKQDFELAAKK